MDKMLTYMKRYSDGVEAEETAEITREEYEDLARVYDHFFFWSSVALNVIFLSSIFWIAPGAFTATGI